MPIRLAGFVSALGVVASVAMVPQPQDPAEIALGKKVFEGKAGGAICFTCHGMNAKGVPGLAPDLTDDKWLHGDGSATFIDSIVRSGVSKPKQAAVPMPPKGGGNLNDEQVRAVVRYVQSLQTAR